MNGKLLHPQDNEIFIFEINIEIIITIDIYSGN